MFLLAAKLDRALADERRFTQQMRMNAYIDSTQH
jgi:hypothetical protein